MPEANIPFQHERIEPLSETPSDTDQRIFFSEVTPEPNAVIEQPIHYGPLMPHFLALMKEIREVLGEGSRLDPTHLASSAYFTDGVLKHAELTEEEGQRIARARKLRADRTAQISKDVLEEYLKTQVVAPGTLTSPPHSSQREWKGVDTDASRSCTTAAFRMIIEDLLGWKPSPAVMAETIIEKYGTIIVNNNVYASMMESQAMREVTGHAVRVFDVMGADFNYISRFSQKVKKQRPNAKVYAIASLASEILEGTSNPVIWHMVVLQQTAGDYVQCQDPKRKKGAGELIPRDEFTWRWATAFNHVQLIVAESILEP